MNLQLPEEILKKIHSQGELAYPEEGAGLLLGEVIADEKCVHEILTLPNVREESARGNRYLISPEDYMNGEQQAALQGLEVLGVYHSHPDHPSQPSEFDRLWAWPSFSYLITNVTSGEAQESRSWRLTEDRSSFIEEPIKIIEKTT
jgi:proteasome lid subunit RPN8/RPN11